MVAHRPRVGRVTVADLTLGHECWVATRAVPVSSTTCTVTGVPGTTCERKGLEGAGRASAHSTRAVAPAAQQSVSRPSTRSDVTWGWPPVNVHESPRWVTAWSLPHARTVPSTVRSRTGPETAVAGTTTRTSVGVTVAAGADAVPPAAVKTTCVSRPGLKFVPRILSTSPPHASGGSSPVMSYSPASRR